jgi:hypothetical protein
MEGTNMALKFNETAYREYLSKQEYPSNNRIRPDNESFMDVIIEGQKIMESTPEGQRYFRSSRQLNTQKVVSGMVKKILTAVLFIARRVFSFLKKMSWKRVVYIIAFAGCLVFIIIAITSFRRLKEEVEDIRWKMRNEIEKLDDQLDDVERKLDYLENDIDALRW